MGHYIIDLLNEFNMSFTYHPAERLEIYDELLEKNIIVKEVEAEILQLRDDLLAADQVDESTLRKLEAVCDVHNISLPITRKPLSYVNSQNVHVFMEDTLQYSYWLLQTYPNAVYKRRFVNEFTCFIEKCTAMFEYSDKRFSIKDVFAALMEYIDNSAHIKTLRNILKTEMDDAYMMCAGGHLARLVNVVKGFPGVPYFPGNKYEHFKAKIFHLLNTHLNFSDPSKIEHQIERYFALEHNDPVPDELTDILKQYTLSEWTMVNGLPVAM